MFPPNFGFQYHITYYAPSLPYTGDPKTPNAIDLKEGVNIFSFFFSKKKITSTQLTLSGRGNRNTSTPRISVGYRRCEVRLRGNQKTKKKLDSYVCIWVLLCLSLSSKPREVQQRISISKAKKVLFGDRQPEGRGHRSLHERPILGLSSRHRAGSMCMHLYMLWVSRGAATSV